MGCIIKTLILVALVTLATSLAQAKNFTLQVALTPAGHKGLEPLRQIQVVDGQGRAWRTDDEGILSLSQRPERLSVVFNHPGFQIESQLSPSQSPLVQIREKLWTLPSSPEASAFVSLSKAYRYLNSGVTQALIPQNKQLEIVFTNEPGCNAVFFKDKLFIDNGKDTCNHPGTIPSLIIHEYGHFIYENNQGSIGNTLLSESFGDLFAAFVTNNPHVGEGLWKNRNINWLRNISELRRYPDHFRGTYSGSQIFSSLFWEALQQKQFRTVEGKKLLLTFIEVSLQFRDLQNSDNVFTGIGELLANVNGHDQNFLVSLQKRGLAVCSSCEKRKSTQTLFASKRPFVETVLVDKKIDLKSSIALPFQFMLPEKIKPTDLSLRLKGSCTSSEYLQVLYKPASATKFKDVYIGQEELPLPSEVYLESLKEKNQGINLAGKIAFQILDKIFFGKIENASLRVYFESPVPTLGITPLIPELQQ